MTLELYKPDYKIFEALQVDLIICDLEGNVTLYGIFFELFDYQEFGNTYSSKEGMKSFIYCEWESLKTMLLNKSEDDEEHKKIWIQIEEYLTQVKSEPLQLHFDDYFTFENNLWVVYEPQIVDVYRDDFETQEEFEKAEFETKNGHQGWILDKMLAYNTWGKLPPMETKVLERLNLYDHLERFNRLYQIYLQLLDYNYSAEAAKKMLKLDYDLFFYTAKEIYNWLRLYNENRDFIKSPFIVK
jgi:hypothetical protein